MAKWSEDKAYRHNFMPLIEAVCLRQIPQRAWKCAFRVCKSDGQLKTLPLKLLE